MSHLKMPFHAHHMSPAEVHKQIKELEERVEALEKALTELGLDAPLRTEPRWCPSKSQKSSARNAPTSLKSEAPLSAAGGAKKPLKEEEIEDTAQKSVR